MSITVPSAIVSIFFLAGSGWLIYDAARRKREEIANRVPTNLAKCVLVADETKVGGIFQVIGALGFFPPRIFLNEFFMAGSDPVDQDGLLKKIHNLWKPFSLSSDEYEEIKAWWVSNHPGAVEDGLEVTCWDDWLQEVLDRLYRAD